jgi:3-hydroxybutyryl-CoA dehydrogenase
MQQVLVIGAGFMGAGIAQVCAQSGYAVNLMDVDAKALAEGLSRVRWSLEKLNAKGLLTEPAAKVMQRITPHNDLRSAADAGWVIEAALEIEDLKKEIFSELDRLAPNNTPLATNTSSIPITRIAAATRHPQRVLGLHFFGPVPFMGLVEVVKGAETSAAVFEKSVAFVRTLGKTPVRVHRDIPGFVMNRIFSAAFREALDLVAEGIVGVEDVDAGMRLGYGWKAGPFEIADNAGLDTFALVGRSLRALGEERLFSRSDLLDKMIAEGRLGKKAGQGFYRYTAEGKRRPWNAKD